MKYFNNKSKEKENSKYALMLFFALCMLLTENILHAQNYNAESAQEVYIAEIEGLNEQLTNSEIEGSATFIISDGKLNITIVANGLHPDMMHLMHIHGFKNSNQESSCTEDENADTNNDGIIDLMETHESSGVTLIPFNADPVALQILSSTYPVANESGVLSYQMTVSMDG